MVRTAVWLACCGLLYVPAEYGQEVRGTVQADGQPVVGAIVSVHRDAPLAAGESASPFTPYNAFIETGAEGAYAIAGLPEGTYRVCVQAPGTDLINTCQWASQSDQKIPHVTVRSGETVETPLTMEHGYRLRLTVEDQDGNLRKGKNGKNGLTGLESALAVGVVGDSGFLQSMRAQGDDGTGPVLELVVPYDRNLELVAQSEAFQLAGADGKKAQGRALKQGFRVRKGVAFTGPRVRVVGPR